MLIIGIILASICFILSVSYKTFRYIYGKRIDNPFKHVSKMTQLDWLYTLGPKYYFMAIIDSIFDIYHKGDE